MNNYEPPKYPQSQPFPDYPMPMSSPRPMADLGPPPPYPIAVNPQYPGNYPQYTGGYMQGPNIVVTTQPMVMVAARRSEPQDYLGYSIFTMLCCCLPIGIAAVVFSAKTRAAKRRGDTNEAENYSHKTLKMNNVALSVGLSIIIVCGAVLGTWSRLRYL